MVRKGRIAAAAIVAAAAVTGTLTAQPRSEDFNRREDVQAISRKEIDVQLFGNVDELMAVVWRNVASAGMSGSGWSEGWENSYDHLAKEYETVSGGAHKPSTTERYAWIRQFNMASDGRLACVAMHLKIPFKKDGEPRVVAFPEFDVWRKFGNSWLAVQLHTYFPVDPSTGKALTSYDTPDRGPIQWSANALPGPATDPRIAEIEARAWLATRTTSIDLGTLMAMFGPGDDVVAFGPTIPVEHRGLREIREQLAGRLANVRSISAEVTDFKVQSDGLMTAILARQNVELTMKDGSKRTQVVRSSNCLRRVGNEWRSMIEMVSNPTNTTSPLE